VKSVPAIESKKTREKEQRAFTSTTRLPTKVDARFLPPPTGFVDWFPAQNLSLSGSKESSCSFQTTRACKRPLTQDLKSPRFRSFLTYHSKECRHEVEEVEADSLPAEAAEVEAAEASGAGAAEEAVAEAVPDVVRPAEEAVAAEAAVEVVGDAAPHAEVAVVEPEEA